MYKIYIYKITCNFRPGLRRRLLKVFACFPAYSVILISICSVGCRKFVEIDTPADKISQENVFSSDPTAISVLTGIYSAMASGLYGNSGVGADMAKYGGLLADELTLWDGADKDHFAYYSNSLTSNKTETTGGEIWHAYYKFIFSCNTAIYGLTVSNSLTPDVKKQLLGEAYFLRSWFYFYLVNLYGELPLALGIDPEVNRLLTRSSIQEVYRLIFEDLSKAMELLSEQYVDGRLKQYDIGTEERVRPTKWAAMALLARVNLYVGNYENAEAEASKVIANTALFNLSPLTNVFLKNNTETILQLQPSLVGWNTEEGRIFNLNAFPKGLSVGKPVFLSSGILNAFEPGDQRRNKWVDGFVEGNDTIFFPAKYKIGEQKPLVSSPEMLTEYSIMLRLAEQYLIRAEARARQNNLVGAIADIDMVRGRANLTLIADTNPDISPEDILNTILHERQVELFTEGHRWLDLKRLNKADEVMSTVTPLKGGSWETTDQLLPIPYMELQFGVNLTQNPGYQ